MTGAGLPQGMVKQRWVTRAAADSHHVGRLLDDGLHLPAAIGAQLAKPERQVLAICGDGDFLQSMQELQTAVLAGTPVCAIVLDNSGWISIKGGQQTFFGRSAFDRLRDAGRLALLPGLRRDRPCVRDPRRARRRSGRRRGRGPAGACVRRARRSSTSRSSATSPSPAPRRPAGGTPRARTTTPSGTPDGRTAWPRSSSDERRAAAAPRHRTSARRCDGRATPCRTASIGTVPILWNNADLEELRYGTDAADDPRRDRARRVRGDAARARLSRGRRRCESMLAERGLRLAEVYAALPATADGPVDGCPRASAASACGSCTTAGGEVLCVALRRVAGPRCDGGACQRIRRRPSLTDAGWDRLADVLHALGRRRRSPAATASRSIRTPAPTSKHRPRSNASSPRTDADHRRALPRCRPLPRGRWRPGRGARTATAAGRPTSTSRTWTRTFSSGCAAGRVAGFAAAVRERLFTELGARRLDLDGVIAVARRAAATTAG